jgi:hypothetical protein
VESLLNAEVIKAATSSSLGALSLMCLILGTIAMAFFKKSQVRVRIMVFTLLFVGVAGFGYSIKNQKSPDPTPEMIPEATREFAIGRWQVEQKLEIWKADLLSITMRMAASQENSNNFIKVKVSVYQYMANGI